MERDAASGSPAPPRRSAARAGLLALLLVVLLALVALASGTRERGAGAPAAPPGIPATLLDYLYTLGVLLLALTFLSAFLLRPHGASPGRDPTGFVRLLVFLSLVTLFGYAVLHGGFGPAAATRLQEILEAQQQRRDATVSDPGGGRPAAFRWDLAAAVAALAVLGAALHVVRLRRRRAALEALPAPTVGEELVALLEDTLEDLRAERDARRAVIAAYARMERTLGAHGLPRHAAEAPLEYLARALRDLEVPVAAALELTSLFERAKFSPHVVDEAMKEDAIAALVTVRDDLRAAA